MCSPNQGKSNSEDTEQQNNEVSNDQSNGNDVVEEPEINGNSSAENSSSDDEDPPCNPDADDPTLEAQLDVLREQSIGNTVYSKRFVLSQLMKLVNHEYELDDEFENNLSLLWDMTKEQDVVIFMAENNALEVFREVVEMAENLRLIEIAVGIVANMCVEKEILSKNRDELIVYLHMFSCVDTPTLIQLMRLFKTIFAVDDSSISWLEIISVVPDFVDNLSNILSNSTNKILLSDALSTVNCMLQRFTTFELKQVTEDGLTVADIFVKPQFVQSIFDVYEFLDVNFNMVDDFEESTDTEYDIYDVGKSFFAIHCTLMQYPNISREVYKDFMPILLREINTNLKEFQNTFSIITWPISFVEDLILSACEIHVYNIHFGYHCDREGFKYFLGIWDFLHFQLLADSDLTEGEENDEKRITFQGMDESLVKCMGSMIDKCAEEELLPLLLEQNHTLLTKLLELYKTGDEFDRNRAENISDLLESDKNKEEDEEDQEEEIAA